MADEELRKRERDAAVGGPDEQARLEVARARAETPEQALERLFEGLLAGLSHVSDDDADTFTFANGVRVRVTQGGYYRGETSEGTWTVAYGGSSLSGRQYSTDHVDDESLTFGEREVWRFRVTAADPDADPVRMPDPEAKAWARRLLRELGLPEERKAFLPLMKLLGVPGWLFAHVLD